MLASTHLRYTRASTISSSAAVSSLQSFLSDDLAVSNLDKSVAGPGAKELLKRLLKGLQEEQQDKLAAAALVPVATLAGAKESSADKAARKAAKEKKRKNKDQTDAEGETKRRKV